MLTKRGEKVVAVVLLNDVSDSQKSDGVLTRSLRRCRVVERLGSSGIAVARLFMGKGKVLKEGENKVWTDEHLGETMRKMFKIHVCTRLSLRA